MRRGLAFIQCTIDDVRIIGSESLTEIYVWIDVAYAVNPDMMSQTGGAMSTGIGIIRGKRGK